MAPKETKTSPEPATDSPKASTLPAAHILFLIYPLTLALGSLYSAISAQPPYDPISQTHRPAPSYFARKDNLLNVYFVKRLWFWITLSLLPLFALHVHQSHIPRAILRYATATAAWVLVTQWAFGPALIDRTFAASGGLCALAAQKDIEAAFATDPAVATMKKAEGVVSGTACRAVGGTWAGGHDISGHVFLLMLGSGVMVLEALPYISRGGWGWKIPLSTAGLCWWMLLMTAIYFHTWFEKLTGWGVAMVALGVIYILPARIAALRSVLGRPGQARAVGRAVPG